MFGPAGGGKSTLLRTMNRLNDLADVDRLEGAVYLNGENLLSEDINVIQLRRNVGYGVFSSCTIAFIYL